MNFFSRLKAFGSQRSDEGESHTAGDLKEPHHKLPDAQSRKKKKLIGKRRREKAMRHQKMIHPETEIPPPSSFSIPNVKYIKTPTDIFFKTIGSVTEVGEVCFIVLLSLSLSSNDTSAPPNQLPDLLHL